jgi:predicted protein tyrosine phosphatase
LDLANSGPLSRIRADGLTIHICGVAELDTVKMPPITHVVSISDVQMESSGQAQRRIAKVCPGARVIHEFFDDVATQRKGAPSEAAVRRILAFTSALGEGNNLLVHCNLGISRSTAIAYAVACQHSPPGQESACYQAVGQARPVASPNILIIRFVDKILGRRGLMVRPVYTSQPGWTNLPERCGICGGQVDEDTVFYGVNRDPGLTVCEACFPSLGVCTGYGRCYLLPDGLRDWWLEQ